MQYDLANISSPLTRMSTIVSLVSAASTYSVQITSIQRKFLLNSFLNSFPSAYNTNNSTLLISYFTASQAAVLYPLFIEAK